MRYDLIVIGGGIVGVGIARDATLRGLSVLLIEKEDFGSGASTKTSKLLHGGLRYLETFEFKLVSESLRERNALLKTDPDLAKPLRFVLPIYRQSKMSGWMVGLGLYLYDVLSKKSPMPRHAALSKKRVQSSYPFLKKEGLKSAFLYYDGCMKDGRILIETMHGAKEAGARLLNYTSALKYIFEEGKVAGVHIKSDRRGVDETVFCKALVIAGGSESDEARVKAHEEERVVRRSQGVHLVLKSQISQDAVLLTSPIDGRVFFLIPWEGVTLLGTTDTEIPAGARSHVNQSDIDYLLASANPYLERPIAQEDIASTFVGVRPLILEKGKSSYSSTRSLKMFHSESGLVTVIGGKYTTFRSIAEKVVDSLYDTHFKDRPFTPSKTYERPLADTAGTKAQMVKMAASLSSGYHTELAAVLEKRWGRRFVFPLQLILECKESRELICPHHSAMAGELFYAVDQEEVLTASDWMERRTPFGFLGKCGKECFENVDRLILKRKRGK